MHLAQQKPRGGVSWISFHRSAQLLFRFGKLLFEFRLTPLFVSLSRVLRRRKAGHADRTSLHIPLPCQDNGSYLHLSEVIFHMQSHRGRLKPRQNCSQLATLVRGYACSPGNPGLGWASGARVALTRVLFNRAPHFDHDRLGRRNATLKHHVARDEERAERLRFGVRERRRRWWIQSSGLAVGPRRSFLRECR